MSANSRDSGEFPDQSTHQLDPDGTYRGLEVVEHRVIVEGQEILVSGLKDAADLLEEADFGARFIQDDVAPYGMELWPASKMLAHFVASQSQTMIARHAPAARMLEIGAGLGLISILAARLGWEVTATDHEPASLAFAVRNAERNKVAIAVRHLDWHAPPTWPRFPVITASDVLYELKNQDPVLSCIDGLLAEDGEAWISDPCRGVADRFERLAQSSGFHVRIESATATNRGGEAVSGRIFVLSR
ncbi:MAG: class I SAM-dependent methyltransferase [Phycisphaerae bacterium]